MKLVRENQDYFQQYGSEKVRKMEESIEKARFFLQ